MTLSNVRTNKYGIFSRLPLVWGSPRLAPITGHTKLLLGLKWQNKVILTIVQLLNQLLFGNFVPVNMLTNHLISNDATPLAYRKNRNHLCKELIDVVVVLLAITDPWFWKYDQIWNDMSFVHKLASGIRNTVERTYDQIWNIFETLTSVGLAQTRPNNHHLRPCWLVDHCNQHW